MDVIAGHFSSQISRMSIDFDSAALQTQQEEEEYDQEDYAREQEVSVSYWTDRLLHCVLDYVYKQSVYLSVVHINSKDLIFIAAHGCLIQ